MWNYRAGAEGGVKHGSTVEEMTPVRAPRCFSVAVEARLTCPGALAEEKAACTGYALLRKQAGCFSGGAEANVSRCANWGKGVCVCVCVAAETSKLFQCTPGKSFSSPSGSHNVSFYLTWCSFFFPGLPQKTDCLIIGQNSRGWGNMLKHGK